MNAVERWSPAQYDVTEILTIVNNEVSRINKVYRIDGSLVQYNQLAEFTSRLTKKFYLQT